MVRKGRVSSVDTVRRVARVTFPDADNVVSAEIPYAAHVTLQVNTMVAVAFFSGNMSDGLIIAAF
jgi:hypothetical protein